MSLTRNILKKITHPILKFTSNKYFSKLREYNYNGISVLVHPEVFPPHYTISTKILLNYINGLNLSKKKVLELGCGSGIISLLAASKGANVTASDINQTALTYLQKAARKNKLQLKILFSDLFDKITQTSFDYIIINPPYYPKAPKNTKEKAWFCGEGFEYFKKLFHQLSKRKDKNVLMILSEDCQIETLKNLAKQNQLRFTLDTETKVMAEKNFIFKIESPLK